VSRAQLRAWFATLSLASLLFASTAVGVVAGPTILAFVAGGDLSGTAVSQTVVGLQGRSVAGTAPAAAAVLTWDGGAWGPATVPTPVAGVGFFDPVAYGLGHSTTSHSPTGSNTTGVMFYGDSSVSKVVTGVKWIVNTPSSSTWRLRLSRISGGPIGGSGSTIVGPYDAAVAGSGERSASVTLSTMSSGVTPTYTMVAGELLILTVWETSGTYTVTVTTVTTFFSPGLGANAIGSGQVMVPCAAGVWYAGTTYSGSDFAFPNVSSNTQQYFPIMPTFQ
jgi:hypothetical protein